VATTAATTKKRVLDFWTLTDYKNAYAAQVNAGGEDWDKRITELSTQKARKSDSASKHVALWEAMGKASQLHEVQYRRGHCVQDPETHEVMLDTGNYLDCPRCDCLKGNHQGVCSHKLVVSSLTTPPPPGPMPCCRWADSWTRTLSNRQTSHCQRTKPKDAQRVLHRPCRSNPERR